MVGSKYNYFVPNGSEIICLNGISHKIFSVSKDSYDYLIKLIENKNREQEKDKEITELLTKMHFLVENTVDETNYFLKRKYDDMHSSLFHLVINPTQDCIFRCWYCYESHKHSKMSVEITNRIKKLALNILKRNDIEEFMLSWFGGEPLMYFDSVVYPLSVFIKNETEQLGKKFKCNMTTNGFLLTKELVKKCAEIGLNSLQVTLDGDEKQHDKTRNCNGKPSFKKILANCIYYCSYSSCNQLILRINYTDEIIKTDFSKVLECIPESVRPQIEILFKRVWQTYGQKEKKTPDGLLENMEKLHKMNFKMADRSDFQFISGCLCYADRINYANINFDGNIYRCTAMDYNVQNSFGTLNEEGEIIWDEKKLQNIDNNPYIHDTKCIECKLLPLCGGPCFMRKYQFLTQNTDYCKKEILDTGLEEFVKNLYRKISQARLKSNKLFT